MEGFRHQDQNFTLELRRPEVNVVQEQDWRQKKIQVAEYQKHCGLHRMEGGGKEFNFKSNKAKLKVLAVAMMK